MLTEHAENLVKAFGYLYHDEAELLQEYAKKIPENGVCINIGAGTGTSAVCVLEVRPDLTKTFYTIDINNHNTPLGGLLNERNAFDNYNMPYPNQIHSDSIKAGKEWKKGKVDFLIIDGDHSTKGATGDIISWKQHLKKGAIVFVHDYHENLWGDVVKVVNELMFDSDDFKFVERRNTYVVFEYVGKEKE